MRRKGDIHEATLFLDRSHGSVSGGLPARVGLSTATVPRHQFRLQIPTDPRNPKSDADPDVSVSVTAERETGGTALLVKIVKDNSSFGIDSVKRLDMHTGYSVDVPVQGADVTDRPTNQKSNLRPWHYKYIIQTNRGQLVHEVRLLKDLEIKEQVRISDYQFDSNRLMLGKLSFGSEGSLITEGRDLQIDAEEIHSDLVARIKTFDDQELEHSVTYKAPGKGGGRLIVNAGFANGTFVFQMHGHPGAQGEKGVDATQVPPAKAAAGRPGEFDFIAVGPRREGGDRPICISQPTDGATGANGVQGGTGFDGFPGGSSGSLYLTVKKAKLFRYQALFFPGLPGVGGPGGKGQPGGAGGDAGAPAHMCKKAKAGANGQEGPVGAQGKLGAVGALGELCVTLLDNGTSCVTREQNVGGVQ
ncbi:hypothetical protein [Bdellovibrio bacteriovorus]|uniref:hypothetical protein n=1 Tax=Bdellovibrio bacteriovorus TaxID=959 RepID=UPI0035A59092